MGDYIKIIIINHRAKLRIDFPATSPAIFPIQSAGVRSLEIWLKITYANANRKNGKCSSIHFNRKISPRCNLRMPTLYCANTGDINAFVVPIHTLRLLPDKILKSSIAGNGT